MERYVRFKDMVDNIGLGDPTGKSTLAISMVIMPPRLSSFNTNQQTGGHVPWMNRTEDILELNRRIIDLNKQKLFSADGKLVVQKSNVGVAPVWFQQAGVDSFNKRDVMAGRVIPARDPNGLMPLARGHIFSSWRETEPDKMMHLSDEVRLKMCVSCLNYFKYPYKIGGPTHYAYYDLY